MAFSEKAIEEVLGADISRAKMEAATRHLKRSEENRREYKTFDTNPLKGIADYATSGTVLSNAVRQMDESIPNGQKHRTEAAYRAAYLSLVELGSWLRAKGYDV